MNLTAKSALERARARKTGLKRAAMVTPATPGRTAPTKVSPTQARAITALPPRIDRVPYIEGQRAAKELLTSMVGVLTSRERAAGVLDRLRLMAEANPHSYAAGVLDVVADVEQLLPPTTEQIDFKERHA